MIFIRVLGSGVFFFGARRYIMRSEVRKHMDLLVFFESRATPRDHRALPVSSYRWDRGDHFRSANIII